MSGLDHRFGFAQAAEAGPCGGAARRPRIHILATGGTIAGKQVGRCSAGYVAGSFLVGDLLESVPELRDLAEISWEQVANVGSQNMTCSLWMTLAQRLRSTLDDPQTAGVVIAHGTDTMEETGYFLNLVTEIDKPVVMVGAMRPATSLSADGPLNLYNAVAVAGEAQARGRGVLIVMKDEIFSAREVQKTHTVRIDAFQSPNRGLAGSVTVGQVEFFAPPVMRDPARPRFELGGLQEFPRTEIIYAYAGMGRDLIDAAVGLGARGIVLAGVGGGNAATPALEALREAVARGVAVVRSSRVGHGTVGRNVEVNDDDYGFISALELGPAKARILLMLGLTRTNDAAELQRYFRDY